MTAALARQLTGMSRMTLHNYVKSGDIKVTTQKNSRVYEYDDQSIYDFIASRQQNRLTVIKDRKVVFSSVDTQLISDFLKTQKL